MTGTVRIAFEQPVAGAPEWVHLIPLGELPTRDGRRFVLDDPVSVIQRFKDRAIDLAVDFEHQSERPEASLNGPVPAAGWVKELSLRPSGIWGRVEWTERARAMIAAREYRFVSPTLLTEKATKRVVGLSSVALVHQPNLHLTALNSEGTEMPDENTPLLVKLADMLGLQKDASEQDIIAALSQMLRDSKTPDPRKFVPVEAMRELMVSHANDRSALQAERTKAKVEKAL